MTPKRILLAQPRGFCAGVDRAVEVIERTVAAYPSPVYCRKEIVHNRHVVDSFIAKGVVFVEGLEDVPPGATVVFSAHGVSPAVWEEARAKKLNIIDATCPLVTKVHLEVRAYARKGYTILYIGHRAHDEVVGVLGEEPRHVRLVEDVKQARTVAVENPEAIVCLTQTTLSVDETAEIIRVLRSRFPSLVTPPKSDICYATQNRQEAVKAIASEADLILVIGSQSSSNSKRLVDVAVSCGARAHLIHDAGEIQPRWLENVETVGVTSGASTPEVLVERVLEYLRNLGAREIRTVQVAEENVTFGLPRELLKSESPGKNAALAQRGE